MPTPRVPSGLPLARILPAAASGLFAGWAAARLPFFPAGWDVGLAVAAAVVTLLRPRAGLALALAVPVFPLGNVSAGLAVLYVVVAASWLALSWSDPRSGLFLVAGPLLAPLGALGAAPTRSSPRSSPAAPAAPRRPPAPCSSPLSPPACARCRCAALGGGPPPLGRWA